MYVSFVNVLLYLTDFVPFADLVNVKNDYAFQAAAKKWSTVITGDLPDLVGKLPGRSSCGPWPTRVDDLYICAQYQPIDGPGGILGFAGPRHYRSTGTPITGEMIFDLGDVDQDWLNLFGVIVSSCWAFENFTTHRDLTLAPTFLMV